MIKELLTTTGRILKNKIADKKMMLRFADKIGPEGIVGRKNYNTHANTIGDMLKKGDIEGVQGYIKTQRAKMGK